MLFNFHFEILQHWQSDALFYQLIMVKRLWTIHVSNKEIKITCKLGRSQSSYW